MFLSKFQLSESACAYKYCETISSGACVCYVSYIRRSCPVIVSPSFIQMTGIFFFFLPELFFKSFFFKLSMKHNRNVDQYLVSVVSFV